MTRPLATLLFLASLSRGRAQSCGNPQVAGSSPDNSGEHALFDTCATSFDRHCGCNSWDFNKIDGVACYEKGPMQSLADIASPQELRSAPQGHVYAACLPVCACAYMPPSIAIDGSEKLYDWTCSVRAGYSDRCGCARKWKSCSYSGCCSDEGFTCTQRNFNTDMSSPYPGFAQCRKAMKPDGSSPFPNKPSYQQCPDTWACHEADVGQTCFTPFSEKAGLVPKGGPPEDLCDNTCTCTYKSFSTKCYDLASPSAGSAYCPLGTDCATDAVLARRRRSDRIGFSQPRTIRPVEERGARSSAVNCARGTSAARSSTWPFPTRLQRRRGRWSATPTRTPPKSSCSPTTPCSACKRTRLQRKRQGRLRQSQLRYTEGNAPGRQGRVHGWDAKLSTSLSHPALPQGPVQQPEPLEHHEWLVLLRLRVELPTDHGLYHDSATSAHRVRASRRGVL